MFLIPQEYWRVAKTRDKGMGVFANKQIIAGTIIGDYLGTIINIAEFDLDEDQKGLYLMYYSDDAGIYPDLTKPGIHLLNHSCEPNCWISVHNGHTLFFALRDIAPGEELTISYLLSPKDDTCDICIHDCKCRSVKCTGTMHLSKDKYDKWQSFLKTQNKNEEVPVVAFGDHLAKLDYYPSIDEARRSFIKQFLV